MCLCFISSPSLWLCWQKKIHKTKSSEQILGTVWLADQVKRAKPMTNLISRLGTGSTVVMFHLNQLSTTFNRQYLAGGFKPSQNSCHSYIIVPNGIRKQGFMKSKEHYWRYRTYYVFFFHYTIISGNSVNAISWATAPVPPSNPALPSNPGQAMTMATTIGPWPNSHLGEGVQAIVLRLTEFGLHTEIVAIQLP